MAITKKITKNSKNKTTKNSKNKTTKNKINLKQCKYSSIPDEFKNIQAVVSINALKNNLQYLRKKSGTDVMPVLHLFSFKTPIIDAKK